MFFKIINLIKLNNVFKKKTIKASLTKSDIHLLKFFMKYNLISSVKKLENTKKNNKFIISINKNDKNKNINIINLYQPSKPVFINLKNLIKYNKKKNILLILSTHKGLITNFEAENLKIGGLLVLKFIS